MKRLKNKYSRPRKLYEKTRIIEESELQKKYGLKNKREIWKALARVNYFRRRAMELAKQPIEEQQMFFDKLKSIGLNVDSIADVLNLQVSDLLERRIQTLVFRKGLANTPRHARQMVVHKKILLNGVVVSSPSYIVRVDEEPTIEVKVKEKRAPEGAQASQGEEGQENQAEEQSASSEGNEQGSKNAEAETKPEQAEGSAESSEKSEEEVKDE
ncbi:30S ribosomal protein S4 [Candidatus Pacearchaeota archaeon]|nr:MAG: 30S ribosomal protein S4 [Candidatus Pacearchaeota archaeon]